MNAKYFLYIPFSVQLRKNILKHLEKIVSYKAKLSENDSFMTDIQDGILFKKAQQKYTESIILSLTVNTDGAKVFQSTKKSIWPIQIYQNFLHPKIRYHPENIIVVGLHSGKPNMPDFFYPLLNELKQIKDEGGMVIEENGRTFNFLPLITSCTADLPAKAEVQGMKGHCGHYGCGYCLHEGDLVKKDKKSKAVVRFIAKDCPIRTHDDMMKTYRKLKSQPINGIKSLSCMIAALDFDLINGFSVDYLHCILLGVTRKMMNLWLDSANHAEPYFISKKRQDELSKRIQNIKPISEITRKPRSILERKDFKANEFRTLLLYYLRYCLEDLLPMRYINHFQLLSSAVYSLLEEKISQENIVKNIIEK